MKKYILILIILLIGIHLVNLNAQTNNADSLKKLLQQHTKNDTIQINLLNQIAEELLINHNEEALKYITKAQEQAVKTDFTKGEAKSLHLLGKYYLQKSEDFKAIEYCQKSLKTRAELGEIKSINVERTLSLLGEIFLRKGDFLKALEHFQKALKISEELGHMSGIAGGLNNIGNLYSKQGDYNKAFDNLTKSLEINQKIGNTRGIYRGYNNLGIVLAKQGHYDKALEYYLKGYHVAEELEYKGGIGKLLNNIGNIYAEQGDYSKALEYLYKSLRVREEIDDTWGKCITFNGIAEVYLKEKKYDKAIKYTNNCLKLATELDYISRQKSSYKILSQIYSATNNYKKAYENHLLFKELNDSMFNTLIVKKTTRLEEQYKYEKKQQTAELEQQKKDIVTQSEIKYQNTLINVFIISLLGGLLTILLFVRLVRIRRKSNTLLLRKNEEILVQKEQISDQNAEIKTQTEELLQHKENLEEIVKIRTRDLRLAKEKAEESSQLKTSFLNNISHEFRTPMNGIMGFSSLLVGTDSSREDQENFAGYIRESCSRLLNIVDDTIEISKVHSKQTETIESDVVISNIINRIIGEFRKIMDKKNIEVRVNLNLEIEHSIIRTDKYKLERVLWHLLDNAVKFTFQGYITIAGQLQNDNYIQFQVEDSGIGIPADIQNKIFEPFRQVETGSVRNYGGNGIGLSLAKAYIELIGGKIWLNSQIDKGTSVFFTLPAAKGEKEEPKAQTALNASIKNKTVLIVEDDELNYILLQEFLSNYKLKLLHAWNGQEALKLFRQEKHIDLILMDLKMPIMDGYEALKQIRIINPDIIIIAQTAYAAETDKEAIRLAGFDDYISKPINRDKLLEKIKLRVN